MSVKLKDIDQVSINYAKALIMDTVRKANSGHTGGPISSLDFTYILFKEFLKSQAAINKKMEEVMSQPKTVYNDCGNQKMTINVFLNEQCKDALNLTDWVNNIKVTLEDLKYSKDNGFVDGVGKMLTKRLQDLKPTERPIHCSDTKRLQFYVKDENKWEKDVEHGKIDESIRHINNKQLNKLHEWTIANPDWMNNEKKTETYFSIVRELAWMRDQHKKYKTI